MKAPTLLATLIAVATIVGACSDDEKEPEVDAGIDAGDTDTGEDTETESESESDTGENETPPELPEDCTAAVVDDPVSGDEDGQWPTVVWNGSAALLSWAYDAEPTTPQWQIQLATYDPGPDGGVGDAVTPMNADVVSKAPAMTSRDAAFGVAWLDSRWDESCTAEAQEDCQLELAFMTFDSSATPANAEPKQVTSSADLAERPAVAATDSGYLVAWIEAASSSTAKVMAVALDADGNPGAPQQISDDEAAATERPPGVAVLGDTAVVVWLGANQNSVQARPIGTDAVPTAEVALIDDDVLANHPQITAGGDGFLISWGRRTYEDFEIYTRLLDADGNADGAAQRVTYTPEDAMVSAPAWSGTEFAVLWLAARANGEEDCVFASCEEQVFATVLDDQGAPRSVPVLLSDDPNTSFSPSLAWDGSGWTGAWELLRNYRRQIRYGRMICE